VPGRSHPDAPPTGSRDPRPKPALGSTQRALLTHLKRRGTATVPALAAALDLNPETVREHLRSLGGQDLVRRCGRRASGPGRPEVVFSLTAQAEPLFPRREAALLREFASHLVEIGEERLVRDFLERSIAARRRPALARVARLTGRRRMEEVANILAELGFMAEVERAEGALRLRLCHCPIRSLVEATRTPCVMESRLVTELLGSKSRRTSYMPDGASACCYQVES